VADVFRALDDETRRLILDELAARDGQSLFELCTALTMLEDAGLVMTERRGRTKLHYFNSQPLEAITERWPPIRRDAP
jgi:DNA-binding transcriptional ArsR family regulator